MGKVINVIILLCSYTVAYGQISMLDSIEITDFAFVHNNPNLIIKKQYFHPLLIESECGNLIDGNQKMVWNIDSANEIKLVSYSRFYRNDTPKDTLLIGNNRFCLEDLMNDTSSKKVYGNKNQYPLQFRVLDFYELRLGNSNYILIRFANILGSGGSYTSMVYIFKIGALTEGIYLGEFALLDDLTKVFMDFNNDENIDFVKWNMVEDADFYSLRFPEIVKLNYKIEIYSDLENFEWFWHPKIGDLPSGVKLINTSKEFKYLDYNILSFYK